MTEDNFVASLILQGAKQQKYKDSVELSIWGLSILVLEEEFTNGNKPLVMISGYRSVTKDSRQNYIHSSFSDYSKAMEFICDP